MHAGYIYTQSDQLHMCTVGPMQYNTKLMNARDIVFMLIINYYNIIIRIKLYVEQYYRLVYIL